MVGSSPFGNGTCGHFASLVDDPSSHPDQFPTEEAVKAERQRLFGIIEELLKWENSNNEKVMNAAKADIRKSNDGNGVPGMGDFVVSASCVNTG